MNTNHEWSDPLRSVPEPRDQDSVILPVITDQSAAFGQPNGFGDNLKERDYRGERIV